MESTRYAGTAFENDPAISLVAPLRESRIPVHLRDSYHQVYQASGVKLFSANLRSLKRPRSSQSIWELVLLGSAEIRISW